jgi:ATP-dependent Zn protease
MPNEEILTSLKNAIERGETLEKAVMILINSGYNPQEVKETSNYLGEGAIKMVEIKPEEHLTMPEQKGIFSIFKRKKKRSTPTLKQFQKISPPIPKIPQQTQNLTQKLKPQTTQYSIKEKNANKKAIALAIILVILIILLAMSFIFRSTILSLF